MPAQPDLFAAAALPGLRHVPELISVAEEVALIAVAQTVALAPFRFQGWTGKRLTASFGWQYDFDDASLEPALPLPEELLYLRDRAAAFAGLSAADLVQVLITRYDPGAGIGWHRDRPVFEHVVGISLATPAILRFRRRADAGFHRRAIELEPRSAYHLSGEARQPRARNRGARLHLPPVRHARPCCDYGATRRGYARGQSQGRRRSL